MKPFSQIEKLFESCSTLEKKYQKIIELGRSLTGFPPDRKTEEFLVSGCQSIVYLAAELRGGQVLFQADSDALVSKGLAALLLQAYSGNSPEYVLQQKPVFIDSLGIGAALSPGRSNGLASMYLHMQKLSLKFLVSIS